MIKVKLSVISIVTASLFAATTSMAQDYQRPLNEYGQPDLQGMWSSESITRLTRPNGVDKLIVNGDEAAVLAANDFWTRTDVEQSTDTSIKDLSTGQAAAAFSTRGYNSFWLSPGASLGLAKDEFRTAWIVDPADGRIPYRDGGAAKTTW